MVREQFDHLIAALRVYRRLHGIRVAGRHGA